MQLRKGVSEDSKCPRTDDSGTIMLLVRVPDGKGENCGHVRSEEQENRAPMVPTVHNRTHPTTGSYFLSLELENARCFSEKQVLDLSDGQGRPAMDDPVRGEWDGEDDRLQLLAAFEPMFEPITGFAVTRYQLRELRFSPLIEVSGVIRTDPGPDSQIKVLHGLNLTNHNDIIAIYELNFL